VPRGVRLTLQIVAALVLIGMVGLFARGLISNQSTVYAQMVDGKHPQAPGFTAPNLNGGGDTSLTSMKGKVVVLNLWASWCSGCKDEAPILNQALSKYGPRGVRVVGVDTNDFADSGRAFAKTYDQKYTLVHDDGAIANRWGFGSGLPVTYVIDRQGVVRKLFRGEVTGESLGQAITPLLGSQG
jgi:cytochrome c biogenesis protein CcmG/thiol:disulfide interchange protein DsbE